MNTTANKITIFRIVLIPLFLVLAYMGQSLAALIVYIIACLSDMADGYIARHYNQISNFGKFMDPSGRQGAGAGRHVLFYENGQMPGWAVVISTVPGVCGVRLRLIAVEQQRVIAAGWSGKIKTACTMVGLCAMLAFPANTIVSTVTTWVIVITTLYSGIEYFYVNRDVFKNAD